MIQLQMIWPKGKPAAVPPSPPNGYSLRTWRAGDEKGYIALMRSAGFSEWGDGELEDVLKKCLPDGLFFVVHDSSGKPAATTAAIHNPIELHPFGGELGWMATDPVHQGRGLGLITCVAVTARFLDGGYSNIFLRTDDNRLPAIKTYLKAGWIPLLHAPDMKERWQVVCKNLKLDFNKIVFTQIHGSRVHGLAVGKA